MVRTQKKKIPAINHFTSLNGQDRIFPHDISTISWRGLRNSNDKKKSIRGISVDPVLNSLNQHHETCRADSKENYG